MYSYIYFYMFGLVHIKIAKMNQNTFVRRKIKKKVTKRLKNDEKVYETKENCKFYSERK